MQLLNISGRHAGRHRLHALALARPEKSLQVDRRPVALLDPAEPGQERSEPSLKGGLPSVAVLVITAPPVNTTKAHRINLAETC
nr:hypothetical protein [Rubellimicrobium roseum]